tara:strand:+ start:3639 stop:4646 length:1008 start_codon:yes stop_codon:yes gene_type:complete
MIKVKKLINSNFCDVIGNTPLIKLKKASEISGCNILGKCEFLNPGGSVKDRAANQIINDAVKNGKISEGGIIVEGTAGNTGIGLTLVANSMNIKTIIVMPETQSKEKKKMLKLCGADLRLVKAVPYKNPANYVKFSEKIAKELKNKQGVFWANQFDNTSNLMAHYNSTGPEIWRDTQQTVDAFICSVGTGGTLTGVAKFLREKKKDIIIGLADPFGSALFNYYKNGQLKSEGNSITEGIGQGRITRNLEDLLVDFQFRISDENALNVVFDILKNEGIILGGSSGINIAGAIKLGQKIGPGKTIVTILCDYGTRYESKIFNKDFLKKNNLPIPDWL